MYIFYKQNKKSRSQKKKKKRQEELEVLVLLKNEFKIRKYLNAKEATGINYYMHLIR